MVNNNNVLIANRGEIVIRVARACKKLGLHPYGIYSDSDKDSLHIKYCEQSLNIGDSLPQDSYLRAGKIVDILTMTGIVIKEGQVLMILEAMKMEIQIKSPVSKRIKEIKVSKGQSVKIGDILISFE